MKIGKQARRVVVLAAFAATLLAGIGIGAAASGSVTRTIEANYMNIKLVVDGAEVTPKDAAGNVVEPFASGGTTYLPVRAVANALGKEVTWDGNTNTVYIGSAVHLPYQVHEADLYDGSNANASFSVAGKTYSRGVVLHSFHGTNAGNETYAFDGSALWNTEGYQTMTFTVGHVGDFQRNAVLTVALEGRAAGEYELKWDGGSQTITVPLGGSSNVKLTLVSDPVTEVLIGAECRGHAESYGVYDVTLN